jgi:hypothetical protein
MKMDNMIHMRVNILMIEDVAKGFLNGLLEENMKVSFSMIFDMDME